MRGPKFTPGRVDRPPAVLEPPAELTEDALDEWHRTVVALCDFRIITLLDRGIIAAYCQAYGRWAQAERALAKMAEHDPISGSLMIKTKSGNVIQNPLVGTANKAMSDMARYAAELGMTPTARARVTQADAPAKLGKKEIATQEALDAGDGTDWGDDLAPATRLN